VATVHEGAVGSKDDREPKIGVLDLARVLSDLPARRSSTVEPAVLVELDDVVDGNVADPRPLGQLPQPISPEVVLTAGDET
jgi:hypothetical protein